VQRGGGGLLEIWKFCRKFRRLCPPPTPPEKVNFRHCGKVSLSHQNKKKTHKSYKIYSSTYHFEQQIILKKQYNSSSKVFKCTSSWNSGPTSQRQLEKMFIWLSSSIDHPSLNVQGSSIPLHLFWSLSFLCFVCMYCRLICMYDIDIIQMCRKLEEECPG
jgi:hypothetical protein